MVTGMSSEVMAERPLIGSQKPLIALAYLAAFAARALEAQRAIGCQAPVMKCKVAFRCRPTYNPFPE
jgi:hypothetical protein